VGSRVRQGGVNLADWQRAEGKERKHGKGKV